MAPRLRWFFTPRQALVGRAPDAQARSAASVPRVHVRLREGARAHIVRSRMARDYTPAGGSAMGWDCSCGAATSPGSEERAPRLRERGARASSRDAPLGGPVSIIPAHGGVRTT